MSKGCGGACCRRFILRASPDEIKEEYEAWLCLGQPGTLKVHRKSSSRANNGLGTFSNSEEYLAVSADIHLVYPMLIHLGYCDWEPCRPGVKTKERSHHYTCKHFDSKEARCTIYEHRPLMCKNYPNGHACLFKGCKLPGNQKRLRTERLLEKKRAREVMKRTDRMLEVSSK